MFHTLSMGASIRLDALTEKTPAGSGGMWVDIVVAMKCCLAAAGGANTIDSRFFLTAAAK